MKKVFYILGLFLLLIPFKVHALGNSYSVLVNELPFSMSNSFQAWDYNTKGGVGVHIAPSSTKVGSFAYDKISSQDYVLSFSTTENFVPGYVYSISVLFSNDGLYTTTNPSPSGKYNITNPCDFLSIGYGYGSFSNYDGAKILACSQADFERIRLNTYNGEFSMADWLLDNQIFTYTFVANELPVNEPQYNTISIRIKGNAEFVGYYISSLGYYSTITDATLSQQIQDVQTSINSNIDSMKEKQDGTNDYLKDDTPPEADISELGNVQGLLPPGPVDSLLNIPFYFLSIVTSSFGGVCTPLSGNFVFDTQLSIPCFSEIIYNDMPEAIMVFINLIPSTFLLIMYFKHLYKKVSRAVSLETTGDDEWGVL